MFHVEKAAFGQERPKAEEGENRNEVDMTIT